MPIGNVRHKVIWQSQYIKILHDFDNWFINIFYALYIQTVFSTKFDIILWLFVVNSQMSRKKSKGSNFCEESLNFQRDNDVE